MSAAAIVVLALVVAGALALIAYLVYQLVARVEQLATKTVEADRAGFERDAATKASGEKDQQITALEAYVTELESTPNADLAPDDIVGRLRRLLPPRSAAQAGGTGDPVRPDGGAAVRPNPPAEDVHGAGGDELLRPE